MFLRVSITIPSTNAHLQMPAKSTRQPRKRNGWEVTKNPRVAPKAVRQLITKLCLLNNDALSSQLDLLLAKLASSAPAVDSEPSDLKQLANRCLSSEAGIAEHSFLHMRFLVMFTLWLEQYVFSVPMIHFDLSLSQL